ncbi:alginate O-acetyltransferase AlgX-related protein [Lysobacter xanthus]
MDSSITREPRRWGLVGGALGILIALHVAPRFVRAPDIAENRELAPLPSWTEAQTDWWGLPKKVDAWVQDHFPARTHLIAGLNRLRMRVGDSGSTRVIVGRDDWLFYDDGSHLGTARAAVPLQPAEADRWVRTLRGRTEAVARSGAVYAVMLAPVKERVYPEHAPGWFRDGGADVDSERLLATAQRAKMDNVLYLLPALRAARREVEPIYTPNDIHWTGLGAYRGYVELARLLTRQGVPVEVWPLSRYARVEVPGGTPRDVALMLGVGGFVKQDFPRFEYLPVSATAKTTYLTERQDWTAPHVIETGVQDKPVLLMTGDSFSNALMPFLLPHFSRIVFAHDQDGFYREELMQQFKPDVVLLEVLESGARHAMAPPMEPTGPVAGAPAGTAAAAPRPAWQEVTEAETRRWANAPAAACNLEVAKRLEPTGSRFHVEGWMFDYAQRRVAPTTRLALVDAKGHAWRFEMPNTVSRGDVAAHFGVTDAAGGGFAADLELPDGAKWPVDVKLLQAYGAEIVRCVGSRTID